MLRKVLQLDFVRRLLKDSPLLLVDIGARSGIHERWRSLQPFLRVVGFEPDADECRRLNTGVPSSGRLQARFFPTALSDKPGNERLLLTKSPGSSSMLEPNTEFLSRFPNAERFAVERTVEVPVDTLDRVMETVGHPADFIKLDVQGFEVRVMQGAERTLDQAAGIEVEVEFSEIYKGQPLFSQVDSFLRSRGFALFDLKRCWWKRAEAPSAANHRGQLIFGDALYFKDYVAMAAVPDRAALIKAVVTAVLYDKGDYAVELAVFGRTKKILTVDEAGALIAALRSQKRIFHWLPSFRGRYWLARKMQKISEAVAPSSWGPSDISW